MCDARPLKLFKHQKLPKVEANLPNIASVLTYDHKAMLAREGASAGSAAAGSTISCDNTAQQQPRVTNCVGSPNPPHAAHAPSSWRTWPSSPCEPIYELARLRPASYNDSLMGFHGATPVPIAIQDRCIGWTQIKHPEVEASMQYMYISNRPFKHDVRCKALEIFLNIRSFLRSKQPCQT